MRLTKRFAETVQLPPDLAEAYLASIDILHLRNVMNCVYTFLDANESVLNAYFDGDL